MVKLGHQKIADVGVVISTTCNIGKERYASFTECMSKRNITGIKKFDGIVCQGGEAWRSCTFSHLKVLEEFIKNGEADTICIFEDDAYIPHECKLETVNEILPKQYDGHIFSVIDQIKKSPEGILIFGCHPIDRMHKVSKDLYEIKNAVGSWGYIINKNIAQYVIENYYECGWHDRRLAIDNIISQIHDLSKGKFRAYTPIPPIVIHSPTISVQPENYGSHVNYLERIEKAIRKYIGQVDYVEEAETAIKEHYL